MNKYNFSDLLGRDIVIDEKAGQAIRFDKIEIPMIQRDYAQGRDSEKVVRRRFLDAIFNAITDNDILDMDFVYGSIYESQDKDHGNYIRNFVPLDGQQRLTTLFLLYWYVGARELNGETLVEIMSRLHKFSYATRASSRKFCENITEKYNDIIPKLAEISPRDAICNFPWFYASCEKDPTIKAMLNMLEDIHDRYSAIGRSDLFGRLDNLKFYILPLDGFNLTEELYVKMNARGKALTYFENFKADLIKWMKSGKNPEKEVFNKTVELDGRQMPYYMMISQKLDNEWADIFWQEIKYLPGKELEPHGYVVDPHYMCFFHRYLCNLVIQESADAETLENNDTFRYFYGHNGDDLSIIFCSFEKYEKQLNFNVIEKIRTILDGLSDNMDTICQHITPAWEEQKNWHLFDKSITQRQRIAFCATTLYLERNKEFKEAAYAEWMRVVWNFIIDPTIRNIPTMTRAMKHIKELAVWSDDILSGLSAINQCDVIENKTDEEATKARLIQKDPQAWGDIIKRAEAHRLFKGEICFLLPDADNTTLDDFRSSLEAVERIFEENTASDNNMDDYLWLRATLAKNEEYPSEITLLNGRFDNWRTLMNHQLIVGLKGIIDSVKAEPNLPANEVLGNICRTYQYDNRYPWVYPIVVWEGRNGEILLQFSESKKIQNYNYYGLWHEQTYLYNKNRWTDGNIMLSTRRNDIYAALIARLGFTMEWEYGNIQNQFFRGAEVELSKKTDNCNISVVFDTEYMNIGIKESENTYLNIPQIEIGEDFTAKGWIWRAKRDYLSVSNLDDVNSLISSIEENILNADNEYSLIYLINKFNKVP